LLMLPILPAMTGFLALADPDSGMMRFLSFFPFTSGSVMPVRLVLGQVSAWEVVLSMVCLLLAIWAMRKLAGIIFRTSVLITGKEPSFIEVWRWALKPDRL
jgi:ABC-2 type transport system permease protein